MQRPLFPPPVKRSLQRCSRFVSRGEPMLHLMGAFQVGRSLLLDQALAAALLPLRVAGRAHAAPHGRVPGGAFPPPRSSARCSAAPASCRGASPCCTSWARSRWGVPSSSIKRSLQRCSRFVSRGEPMLHLMGAFQVGRSLLLDQALAAALQPLRVARRAHAAPHGRVPGVGRALPPLQ